MENRPAAIVKFERLYLAAFVLGLGNTALSWSAALEKMRAAPTPGNGIWYLLASTILGFAITLSLWYFVARKGSVVAKWIAAAFLALGVFGLAAAAFNGFYPTGIGGVIGVVTTVLQFVAIAFLFTPEAKPWFAKPSSATA